MYGQSNKKLTFSYQLNQKAVSTFQKGMIVQWLRGIFGDFFVMQDHIDIGTELDGIFSRFFRYVRVYDV